MGRYIEGAPASRGAMFFLWGRGVLFIFIGQAYAGHVWRLGLAHKGPFLLPVE